MGALQKDNQRLQKDNARLMGIVEDLGQALKDQQKAFKEQKEALERTLEELKSLKQKLYGRKSERMPPPGRVLKKERTEEQKAAARQKAKETRARNKDKKQATEKKVHHQKVEDKDRFCAKCDGAPLKDAGERIALLYDYVPGYFILNEHHLERLLCPKCRRVVCAEVPDQPFEDSIYSPRFIAWMLVSKCADALPLHRLEKMFERQGIPMSRKTMCDLFHRAADLLAPLVTRLFALIAATDVVQADETTLKMQGQKSKAYLWTFVTEQIVAYRFSKGRSGEVPQKVLGGTKGQLIVDGYTGYNKVVTVEGRTRCGCWAHGRRKLHECRGAHPVMDKGLELILGLYRVEAEAKEKGLVGSARHLALRLKKSAPILDKLKAWLQEQEKLHPPRSKVGRAVRYPLKRWSEMTRFLEDARIPIDNNKSEGALRSAALGRKNWLFVGHKEAGERLATLFSLVSTCLANGVNPELYLEDVLLRISTHPMSDIDALLPQNWRPLALA